MAVNLEGFVTPEQGFGGLYKLSGDIEKKRQREEELSSQKTGKRNAAATFLTNYLDQKDFLTGTNYDPEIVRQLNDTMKQGAELASQGADTPTIMMALGPKVSQLHEYSTKAKLIRQNIKDRMQLIPQNAGYDKQALENTAARMAFYDESGKLKDIGSVDPNTDWLSETIKQKPELVTTDAGFDEFVKTSPKYTDTKDVTTFTPSGGMTKKKMKITAPPWVTVDTDNINKTTELVPKYQIALENGSPQMHTFKDANGKDVSAPVRLLDERLFDSMMSQNHGMADWIRGQVKSANPNIDLSSPQAKNAARAIAYDELKRRIGGGMEDVEIQDKPSTYEIKNYLGIGSGGGTSAANYRDIFNEIKTAADDPSRPHHTVPLNELSTTAQNAVIEQANKLTNEKYGQADLYIEKDKSGNYNIVDVTDKDSPKRIAPLDFGGTNITANKGLGTKAKQQIVSEEKQQQSVSAKSYTYKGVTGTYDQLVQAFGKDEADRLIKSGLAKEKNKRPLSDFHKNK